MFTPFCIFFTIIFLIVLRGLVYAQITLPWSTSFNYPECTQRGQGGKTDCANVQNDGIAWSWGAASVNGNYTQVTSAANYHAGASSNGFRAWVGDGHNIHSGPIRVSFSSTEKELWIRWYMRFQEGFNWSSQHYDKYLYIRTNGTHVVIPGMANGQFYVHASGNTGNTNLYSSLTWNNHMGGASSNGEWICMEIYMKMDTDSSNGILRQWMNGLLVQEKTNVNFSGGNATDRNGWAWFDLHNNQNEVDNLNGPIKLPYAYVDYDDMVIYNETPQNIDASGNSFIGPIEWSGGTLPTAPLSPTGLKIIF